MIKGSCKGKADAIVNCQCNIESAPVRCEQAEEEISSQIRAAAKS